MKKTIAVGLLLALALLIAAEPADYLLYVGTFTTEANGSKGIYAYRFHDGKLTALGLAAESLNPSFLVVHPNHRYLYAVNNNRGLPENTVSAFSIDRKSGKLALLNKVDSRGEGPAHAALDHTAKWLAVTNYGTGTVAILPVMADGKLGSAMAVDQHEETGSNRQPRAHMALFSADNRFLLVADVGIDRVYAYKFDATKGTIAPGNPAFVTVARDSGARHIAWSQDGSALFVVTERGSTVEAFRYTASTGALSPLQTISTLPAGYTGRNSGAEIAVGPSGRFVYASNRGHDSIAVFSINPADYKLRLVEHVSTRGKTPRNFAFDPTGAYLVAGNEGSSSLAVFRANGETGALTPMGDVVTGALAPACLLFVPAN